MVKRTTGKHAKPKASIRKLKKDAAEQSDSASLKFTSHSSAIGAEEGETSVSQNLNSQSLNSQNLPSQNLNSQNLPSQNLNSQNLQADDATQAMPAQSAGATQAGSAVGATQATSAFGATQAMPAQSTQNVSAQQATAAMPTVQASSGASTAHQASASVTPGAAADPNATAAQNAFTSTAELLNKKSARRRKTAKILGITSLSLVGAIAAIYFVGVFVFSTHFMPNTHISDIDLTMKTAQDLHSDFEEKIGNYTVKVKGNGLDLEVASSDADVKVDSYGIAREIMTGQNIWAWPLELILDHDYTYALNNYVSADSLATLLKKEVKAINKTASDPTDALCQFSPEQNQYVIIGEQAGTKLDYDSVMNSVLIGVMGLEDMVVLDSSTLVPPKIVSTDENLVEAASKANKYASANLNIKMGDYTVASITPKEISQWITISKKHKVKFDDESMKAWVQELAEKLNTVGSERTYKRADGKEVTVSGGDYGWAIDTDATVSKLATKIKNGAVEDFEVPVLQSGSGFEGVGGKDWGKRYIDVDISQQHATFYGTDGKIIWESDIVSGLPSAGRATPQGVFDINLKGTNITLVGRNKKGKVTYRTKVTYWMPFKDNAVGFHDATWQPSFGGSRYLYGGSHGCVNLPRSKAEELYGIIQVGDVVVVHS